MNEPVKKVQKNGKKDGLGTKYPFQGAFPYINSGIIRYNGGCLRGKPKKWYEGDEFFLPKITKNFEWIFMKTWCWRLVKKEKNLQNPLTSERNGCRV